VTGPAVREAEGGALFKVRLGPGASRERIVGLYGDALKVAVREPPEKGRANRALEQLLAGALGLAARAVRVARGRTSRDKWVRAGGLDADALRARLDRILVGLHDKR